MMVLLLALVQLLALSGAGVEVADVDPFLGSGGYGYGYGSLPPGARTPFPLVRLSPDTAGWDDLWLPFEHFSGYHPDDALIRSFSHVHMQGAGSLDLGVVATMASTRLSAAVVLADGFRAAFAHAQESASPGYYAVQMAPVVGQGAATVHAELTATRRVGVHRYTAVDLVSNKTYVLFPIGRTLDPGACRSAAVHVLYDGRGVATEIYGHLLSAGSMTARFGGLPAYFSASFGARSPAAAGVWVAGTLSPGAAAAEGCNVGAYAEFDGADGAHPVEVAVGVSLASLDGARRNRIAEVGNRSFDDVRAAAEAEWARALAAVRIGAPVSGLAEDTTKFSTFLFNALSAPSTYSDVDGAYVGFDGLPHTFDNDGAYRSDLSIWDIYRTQAPFLAMLFPDAAADVARSLELMLAQGGDLPRWPMLGYTDAMIGQHADIVVASFVSLGLSDAFMNLSAVLDGMVRGATEQRPQNSRTDVAGYLARGYVSAEASPHSAPLTLAYAYDDWAISRVAAAIGRTAEASVFAARARNYRNVFDNSTGFMCPRQANGAFLCPVDNDLWYVDVFSDYYVEGDAEQYRWLVEWDVDGLTELLGGRAAFVRKLDAFFEDTEWDGTNVLPNPFFWVGNEPSFFIPFEFALAGQPKLTQRWTRYALDNLFGVETDGYAGNDDYGAMSSWGLFSMLGLFPIAGSDEFVLVAPYFASADVALPRFNATLSIRAVGAAPGNYYVSSVTLNGVRVTEPVVRMAQLVAKHANELVFTMTPDGN